jgi:hypothetical protein
MSAADWFDDGGTGSPVDVPALLDSEVPALMGRCCQAGALVSMGTTSDGGAMSITVTLDGRWKRQYFRDAEEAITWLGQAAEAVELEAERLAASQGPRGRGRGRKRA